MKKLESRIKELEAEREALLKANKAHQEMVEKLQAELRGTK